MAQLQKAYIVEIGADEMAEELAPRFPVQFNPTSLKLQISSGLVGGTLPASHGRQSTGAGTTTLSLELVFDTADEGSTNAPRSVREKTAQVERFAFPTSQTENGEKQPKLRFQWGSFVMDGEVASISVDLDHFAADGTPLRARVNLSINEQNAKLIFLKGGPFANQKGNSPSPLGAAGGSLGISGGLGISNGGGVTGGSGVSAGATARFGVALDGESLPEFSARAGLDPAAWRGLSTDIGLSGDLSLEAGVEVAFSGNLNAGAGLGVTLGTEAGVSASLEASFGLEANASISAVAGVGAGADLAAGFSLSAAGGLSAALESVQAARNHAAEQQTRAAFGAPAVTTAAPQKPRPPEQPRSPLTITGLPSASQQQSAPPAPPPPRADPRSASFGFGVPLRSTVGAAAIQRADAMAGGVSLRHQVGDGLPPSSDDPTMPPWVALPTRDRARVAADERQHTRHPAHPCGCVGRCRCTGGHRWRSPSISSPPK